VPEIVRGFSHLHGKPSHERDDMPLSIVVPTEKYDTNVTFEVFDFLEEEEETAEEYQFGPAHCGYTGTSCGPFCDCSGSLFNSESDFWTDFEAVTGDSPLFFDSFDDALDALDALEAS
jgi:hypothetical protein